MRNRARQRGGQGQTTENAQRTVSSSATEQGGVGDLLCSAADIVASALPVRSTKTKMPELPDISKEMQLKRGFISQAAVQSAKDLRNEDIRTGSGFYALTADGVYDRDPNLQVKRGYVITKDQALAAYSTVNELEPQIRQWEKQIQTDHEGLLSQAREIRRMQKRLELLKKNYDTDPSQVNATIWNEAYAYYTQLYQDYTNKQDTYGSAYQEYSRMVDQYGSSAKTYNDYISMFYRDDGSLDYEILAENAEHERDKYLASPERAQFVAQQQQKVLDDTASSYLKGGTPDPGYVPGQGYGYLAWKSGAATPVDSKKRELESVAAYYRQQADLQYDQDLLNQRLQEIESWTPEEQEAFHTYYGYYVLDNHTATIDKAVRAKEILYNKLGKDGLEKYARAWERHRYAEAMQDVRDWAEKSSDGFGGGLLHSIGSVGAGLAGMITSPIGAAVDLIRGPGEYRTLDPNNPLYMPNVYASTVRGNVAENIAGSWAGEIGSTLYQAGMSAADNLTRLAVAGPTGSLVLAGTGSFGQTVQEASAQGATPLQATIRGLGAGALEVLTEEVSLDRLLGDVSSAPGSKMEILKRALTSAGVEASEEELNFMGNILLETIVMQGRDNYTTRIGKLVAGGMSYQEAASMANRELVGEAIDTAVQSGLSGGMMGGAANTYAYVKDTPNRRARKQNTAPQTAQPDGVTEPEAAPDGIGRTDVPMVGQAPKTEENTFERAHVSGSQVTVQPGVQVDAATMGTAQRLSELTGRDIVFYTSNNRNHNGYYNRRDGKIYINARSRQVAEQVFAHELTHSVESAGAYEQLRQAAFSWMENRGMDIDSQRQEIRDLYAREGVQFESETDVDYEIVARFVEQNLLTDEQSIRDVVRYDRSLGQKILNWIDRLLAKFQNKNAQERALLERARAAYAKALQQTQTSFTRETAADSVDRTEQRAAQPAARDTEAKTPRMRQTERVKTGDPEIDRELEELADLRNRGLMDDKTYRWNVQQVLDEHRQRQPDRAAEPRGLRLGEQFEDAEGFEDDEDFEDWYETMMHDAEVDGTAVSHSFSDGETEELAVDDSYDEGYSSFHNKIGLRGERKNMPQTGREWSAFNRSFANKTTGMKPGEIRSLTIYTSDYVYFVEADAYMSGYAESRIRLTKRNIARINAIRRSRNGIDTNRETFNRRVDSVRGERGEHNWGSAIPSDGKTAESADRLYEKPPGSDGTGHLTRDETYFEDEVEEYAPGSMVFDGINGWDIDEHGRARKMDLSSGEDDGKQYSLSLPAVDDADDQVTIGELQAELYQLQHQRRSLLEADTAYAAAADNLRYANTFTEKVAARKAMTAAATNIDTAAIDQRISDLNEQISEIRNRETRQHREDQEKYSGTKTAGYSTMPDTRLKNLDQDYMKAVQSGDRARMAELVEQAAEAAMPASVVRDKSGRLLKTYHHTGNRFTVFDRNMARTGTEMDGFFFAPDPDSTSEYGSNIITAYLNITKLAMDPKLDRKFNDSGTLLREKLAYQGYDGMARTENGEIYEYMTFDPEQIKSADPVVYDDRGRVVPLSERFNFRNPDMRYSVSEEEEGTPELSLPSLDDDADHRRVGDDHSAKDTTGHAGDGTTEEAAPDGAMDSEGNANADQPGLVRKSLPAKAREKLERTERKLVKKLSEGLMDENASVPKAVRTEKLMPIVQKISDKYLQTGALDQDLTTELFDWTFAESVVRDAEYYDQYKEVRNRLRSTAVTLSRQDQSDIPDFALWRKSAFGTLKIVNQGGLPVDTFYDELRGMAPELFPEDITHPADQLQRMYQVGQSIRVTERSLQEYFGPETERLRQWARYDFDNAMNGMLPELRRVRRYGEDAAARAARDAAEVPATLEEVVRAYAQLKTARKNYERAADKWLLTQEDEQVVYQLLRGERTPESLDPSDSATAGILAVYNAKQAYEDQAKIISKYKRKLHADRRAKADTMLGTVRNWIDKRSGFAYSRETMRRNILDIVPDRALAEQILEEYFDPVQMAEAASTRFRSEYRDRVRKLGLSRKVDKKAGNIVSEAHAVQLLGEALDNIEYLRKRRKYKGQEPARGGKTMEEWQAAVDDLWANNPGLDAGKIEGAVREFRKIYDELFRQMNEARIRNGYEPINYLQGYFPHFQPGDGDGILAAFGRGLGINTQVAALPTTINGLTHTFRPGIQWFGNAQERLGFNTAYDAVEGFDKYIEGVASVIHHTDNIQNLRALATQIRYNASDEGIKRQVDAVRNDDRLTEEEKKAVINGIYERGKYALSNFVTELDEYTNLLANKKSRLDRTTEALLGRRFYAFAKWWENRVGANMIAGNIGSAVTNFIPITQATARVGKRNMLAGILQTLSNLKNSDGFAGQSDFITNRRGSDTLVTTGLEKASKVAGILMEGIDNFVSESITRAAYRHYLQQGFSEAEALHQADIFAAGVLGDRSKGAMPTLFSSTNPVFKAFTQFQLEVNNQFSEIFKDLPREIRDKFPGSKIKQSGALLGVLLEYFIGAFLFNDLFEELFGRRPALDPLGMLNNTVGDITGYELPNLIGMWEGGITLEDFQTEQMGVGKAVSNLTTDALGNLPFSSGLMLMGIELDGGRIPASSAVPNLADVWQAATTEGWSAKKRWKEIQDELNKLAYVVPPFGGNQAQKIWKGLDAYFRGGSYSVDKDGNDILQYPVYKDGDIGDFWTAMQAALFGKSSLDEAQDWVDAGFNSLGAEQTAVYQDLLDADVDD